MKRFILVGLVVIALFAMLCVGLVIGAFLSPKLLKAGQALEQRLNLSIPGINPETRRDSFQSENLFRQQGIIVAEVVSGSPAEKAGLQTGDFILSLDGKSLEQPSELIDQFAKLKPGDTITLEVMQPGGPQRTISVKLGENPEKKGSAWLGVQIGSSLPIPNLPDESQKEQLPALPHNFSFGQELQHPGALISEVLSGSPAEKAGLKAGDFIQAVDGVQLQTPSRLSEIIAGHKPGDTVTLSVINAGTLTSQPKEVKLTLGENPDKAGTAWLGIRYSAIDINVDPEPLPGG